MTQKYPVLPLNKRDYIELDNYVLYESNSK